ncbi:MAG TPA: hypothetical protein VK586_03315 [Streptosporangiaceae bacterium]|nr:hypothetical protein [Streptosporangiaceae bacterium]
MAHSARSIVSRPAGRYRDALRSYRLEVDDVARGRLKPGQAMAVEVEPGRHAVRARLDWSGSPPEEVGLGPGEEVRLLVQPAGTVRTALPRMFGGDGYLCITAEPPR